MATARGGHTATLLADGRVLVTGGFDGSEYLATTEIYDPMTDTFGPTGPWPPQNLPRSCQPSALSLCVTPGW
jgi:hypothetical protein